MNYQSGAIFSKSPVTYETFCKRIDGFNKILKSKGLSRGSLGTTILEDAVRAGKILQRNNSSSSIFLNENEAKLTKFLDLKLDHSNSDIDRKLFEFLRIYKNSSFASEPVTRAYLLWDPRPKSAQHIIEMVGFNFLFNINLGIINRDLVEAALNVLLDNKDYRSCFQVVDVTYNSPQYLTYKSSKLLQFLGGAFASFGIFACSLHFLLPAFPLSILTSLTFVAYLICVWFNFRLKTLKQVGRLSWRPQTDYIYKFQHNEEMLLLNKIINHFEEYNEVHIKNFHHSEIRAPNDLSIINQGDYILELPIPEENTYVHKNTSSHDFEVTILQSFFRSQLRKRRLVLSDLQEELMFLEFWMSRGENFVWMEPDQDPAEIIKLKLETNLPKLLPSSK